MNIYWTDVLMNLQLFNDLFKNNANLLDVPERKHNHNYFMEMVSVDGMYDYMMYLGESPADPDGDLVPARDGE